jgi:hypothetical protein
MQEPTFDLSQRLTDNQLSLAWAYLALESEQKPGQWTPLPQELSHLTEPEWYLVAQMLAQNLYQRAHQPLH